MARHLLLALSLASIAVLPSAGASSAAPHQRSTVLVVSPNGSDAAQCTERSPCRTLARAYGVAGTNSVIQLQAGTYPEQSVTGKKPGTKRIVFRSAPGTRARIQGIRVANASRLTFRRLDLGAQRGTGAGRGLLVDACSSDIRFESVRGDRFLIVEGTRGITFRGGSWGGYGEGRDDSAIGTAGATGPTRICNGRTAAPARKILFDGVTFHDVYWGKRSTEWNGAHPDCFEINGYADGVVLRNSRFIRCASTFTVLGGDQGDIKNVTFAHNIYLWAGPDTYFALQITSGGKVGRCGNVVFRNNYYFPMTAAAGVRETPLRTDCATVEGMRPLVVRENFFAAGPPQHECERYRSSFAAKWVDNAYARTPRCGDRASGVPFGYSAHVQGLRPAAEGSVVRQIFALAARRYSTGAIARVLRRQRTPAPHGRWDARTVAQIVKSPFYLGRRFGPPGTHVALVSARVWRRAQQAVD
jgi:Recombinase